MSDRDGPRRRDVLEGAAIGLSAVGGYVWFSGDDGDPVELNVGYGSRSARASIFDRIESVVREYPFRAATVKASKYALSGLVDDPGVRYVEPNGEMRAVPIQRFGNTLATTAADGQCLPWGVDRVDADVAHEDGATGEGVDVAVVDTGIDDDHPDLEPNLGEGEAIVSCRGDECNEPWSDDMGHGTHCAGIVAAADTDSGVRGVAPGATLHSVKVLDGNGRGTHADIAAGIEHVADRGWDVCSMSLGGGQSNLVADAVQYAADEGVVLVAAAGNAGPCEDCVGYPAAEPEVIAVSATTAGDDLADFSSTGPEIELAAPGEEVYSTVIGGYDRLSGTSMACPHVAGAAAQVIAQGHSAADVRDGLGESAEDVGLGDAESGAGLLDVASALGLDSDDDGTGNC